MGMHPLIKHPLIKAIPVLVVISLIASLALNLEIVKLPDWSSLLGERELGEREKTILVEASKKTVKALLEEKPIKLGKGLYLEEYGNKRVYVTLRKNGELIGCQSNKTNSENLVIKVHEATKRALTDSRFSELDKNEFSELSIEINILNKFQRVWSKELNALEKEIELGVEGIKIEQGEKRALFLPAVPVKKGYSLKKTLERLCSKAGLGEECASEPKTKIYTFTSEAFIYFNGQIIDLYRGNALIKEENVTLGAMNKSLNSASEWFKEHNKKNAAFTYEYFPSYDWESDENSNIRQFAALWIAGKLAHHQKDKELKEACLEKGKKYSSMLEREGELAWFKEGKTSKLGTSALLMLALMELNKEQFGEEIELLGNFLCSMQRADGAFYTHYPKKTKKSSENYYPGEALLALMTAFEKTGKEEYLNAVEKAYPYYKKHFEENKNTAFVPWQSSAYSKAFLATGKKEYAEFALKMTDWIMKKQYGANAPYPDYVGGFSNRRYPSFSACTYAEGLGDTILVARKIGDGKRLEEYEDSMKKAMRFALQLQFNEKNTYEAKKPKLSVGGYKSSVVNEKIRVDTLQHCGSAILKFIELKGEK